MSHLLKRIDLYGEKVKFYIKNEETINTVHGGLLTIITIAVIAYATWLIGNDIFYKRTPTAYTESFIQKNFPLVNVNRTNFPFALQVYDIDNNVVEDDRIFKMTMFYMENFIDPDNPTVGTGSQIELELEPCQYYHFPNVTKDDFIGAGLPSFKCAKNDSIPVFGYFSENKCNNIRIKLSMCSSGNCVSEKEILDYMKIRKINLNLIYLSPFLINSNFSQPVQNSINLQYFFAQTTMAKAIQFGLEQNTLVTDSGSLFEQSGSQNFLKLTLLKSLDSIDIDDTNKDLIIMDIYSSNMANTYYRKYIKIPDILATIGGLMSVFFTVFGIINIVFARMNKYLLVINSVFDVENLGKVQRSSRPSISKYIEVKSARLDSPKPHHSLCIKNMSASDSNDCSFIPLRETSEKIKNILGKRSEIHFSPIEAFKVIICRRWVYNSDLKERIRKYDIGVKEIKWYFDHVYVIKKLEEFELLKRILFSAGQLRIYDVLKKLKTNETVEVKELDSLEDDLKNLILVENKTNVEQNLIELIDKVY
jgi:hypothetical protein